MSYSRWGCHDPITNAPSIWYVFRSASKDGEPTVTVCGVASFTYRQLMDDFEGCLATAIRNEPAARSELEELSLRDQLKAFLKGCEESFKEQPWTQSRLDKIRAWCADDDCSLEQVHYLLSLIDDLNGRIRQFEAACKAIDSTSSCGDAAVIARHALAGTYLRGEL